MPYGPGTYGKKVGRPPAKKKKPLSPKQKTIARMAGNPNKIDAKDLMKLRSRGKK